MKKWVRFSNTVRISDMIAASAIMISGIGIIISIGQSNGLVRREQDRNEREAAVRAIARLDRWQAVQASLQQQMQPIIIRTTENLRDARSPAEARDLLWREVVAADAELDRRITGEQLDTGYEEVLVYIPRSRQLYLNTYSALEEVADNRLGLLLQDAQQEIMSAPSDTYSNTARLGNRLRDVTQRHFQLLATEAEAVTRQPRLIFCQRIARVPEDVQVCASPAGEATKTPNSAAAAN